MRDSWLPEQKPFWVDLTDSAVANTPMSVGQACRNQETKDPGLFCLQWASAGVAQPLCLPHRAVLRIRGTNRQKVQKLLNSI